MIQQCKGKDYLKVPTKFLEKEYYESIKYDGHYTQIIKVRDTITFFTSGGKPYYLDNVAEEVSNLDIPDSLIECEFVGKHKGLFGDREKAALLSTYRAANRRGERINAEEGITFRVFDIIPIDSEGVPMLIPFKNRLGLLEEVKGNFLKKVEYNKVPLKESLDKLDSVLATGAEGLFLKSPSHCYIAGKRSNDALKLKRRPSADLKVIEVLLGKGQFKKLIGSLIAVDGVGRRVTVGTGLTLEDRKRDKDFYLDKIIEVTYERIRGNTYIQPAYKGIREDREKAEDY